MVVVGVAEHRNDEIGGEPPHDRLVVLAALPGTVAGHPGVDDLDYDLDDTESDVYDWAYQTLMVSLPRIVREWKEWAPFIGDLFQEALIEGAKHGKTMFFVTSNTEIEA